MKACFDGADLIDWLVKNYTHVDLARLLSEEVIYSHFSSPEKSRRESVMKFDAQLTRQDAMHIAQQLLDFEMLHCVACTSEGTTMSPSARAGGHSRGVSKFVDSIDFIYRFQEDEEHKALNERLIYQEEARDALKVACDLLELLLSIVRKRAAGSDYDTMLLEELNRSFRDFVLRTAELQKVDISELRANELKAFALNTFHLLTLHSIWVDQGFPKSPKNRPTYFRKYYYNIGGQKYCGEDLVHGMLRGNRMSLLSGAKPFTASDPRGWYARYTAEEVDARIHFAVCYGMSDQPAIRVYHPETLDAELNQQCREAAPALMQVQMVKKTVTMPLMFEWYMSDFGSTQADLISFALNYLPVMERTVFQQFLLQFWDKGLCKLEFRPLTWSLQYDVLAVAIEASRRSMESVAASEGALSENDASLTKAVELFNEKPTKGIDEMIDKKIISGTAESIARALKDTKGLDKKQIGEYLGGEKENQIRVLEAFIDALNFEEMGFDDALRFFLSSFWLPGEAQKIDRIVERFAKKYVKNNPGIFKSEDAAYTLAFSVIMLNTDAHNPSIPPERKMTKQQFINNNRGCNDGENFPQEFLENVYDRIKLNEIKLNDEDGEDGGKKSSRGVKTFTLPQKQGWLTKQGGRKKVWRERWFILKDGCLYYFKSPPAWGKEHEMKGMIPLEGLAVRKVEGGSKKMFCFEIFTPDGTGKIKAVKTEDARKSASRSFSTFSLGHHEKYLIAARAEEERSSWVHAISLCKQKLPTVSSSSSLPSLPGESAKEE
uniref:Uncharacterized protein n=1 Tax=Palpitomonas bilix TaxID=652834 RepID=A0A7S3DGR3_9EUKA